MGDKCMPRSSGQGILPLNPEIERTLRSLRKININANVLQAQQGHQPKNEACTLRGYLRPVVN